MVGQQLIDYISHQLSMGASPEEIKKALASGTWSAADIEAALKTVAGQSPPIAPPAPIQVSSVPAAQIATVHPPLPPPSSVRIFEVLMYANVALGITVALLQLGASIFTLGGLYGLLALAMPIGKIALTWLSVHRSMEWGRYILLAFFLYSLLGMLGVVSLVQYNPLMALMAIGPIALEGIALGFAFTSASNRWFGSISAPLNAAAAGGVENLTWSKHIPRINNIFFYLSLALVFVLDLGILVMSPSLFAFWAIMLLVFGIFGLFYYRENYVYAKQFAHSVSHLDKWIAVLIILRNIVVILNFIPFIQIAGMAIGAFGIIPYVIIYTILINRRSGH